MVNISELKPGMRVKLIDRWIPGCCQNFLGKMDHWLGQIVTVKTVYTNHFIIEEDEGECCFDDGKLYQGGHWHWNGKCVDSIVSEKTELPEINDTAAELILSFLFPGV